jgi:hypothetical protein
VQAAVVDDVLARRQARVQAARVAQHAQPGQRLLPGQRRRRCRPPRGARRRAISRPPPCAAWWSCRRRWGPAGR